MFIISIAECHTGDSAVSNCRRAQQPYAHHLQFTRESFQGFKDWLLVLRQSGMHSSEDYISFACGKDCWV